MNDEVNRHLELRRPGIERIKELCEECLDHDSSWWEFKDRCIEMKIDHMPDFEEREKLLKKAKIGVWRCLKCGHDRPGLIHAVGGLPEPDKQYDVFVDRNTIGCPRCGKSIVIEMSPSMGLHDPWKTCPVCGSRRSRNMFVEIRKMQIGKAKK